MDIPSSESMPLTVVIGYGNPLRGDDAVGQRVAEAVASWRRPHVHAIAVQQLTPELAELLADAGRAIFVDAGLALADDTVQVTRIEPSPSPPSLGHVSAPSELLALARAIYGRCPLAWGIILPTTSFAFGACLSPTAQRGLATALLHIAGLEEGSLRAEHRITPATHL